MPSHLLSASEIVTALNAGTITVAQAGVLQIQRVGGNVLEDFRMPPQNAFFAPQEFIPPNFLGQQGQGSILQPLLDQGGPLLIPDAIPSGSPINFIPGIAPDPGPTIQFSPPTQGGIGMVQRFGVLAAPAIIIAFKAAARLTNRGAAMRLGPLTGRGVFQSIIAGLGIAQAVDIFRDQFGDSSKEQMLGELVEELIDSGYILWDSTDRRGNERTMEYIVIPVGDNSDREATYGMAYRPFSRSSIRKRDQSQDTYRRPTRARRQTQGSRSRR